MAPVKANTTSARPQSGTHSKTATKQPKQFKTSTNRAKNGRFNPKARASAVPADGGTRANTPANQEPRVAEGLATVDADAHSVERSPSMRQSVGGLQFEHLKFPWMIPSVFSVLKRRLGLEDDNKYVRWIIWVESEIEAKTRLEKENTKLKAVAQKDAQEAERLQEEIDELQAKAEEKAANEEEKMEQLQEEIDKLELEMNEKSQEGEEKLERLQEEIDRLEWEMDEKSQEEEEKLERLQEEIDRLESEMDEKIREEEEEKQGLQEQIDELQIFIDESDQVQRAVGEELYEQVLAADSDKRALKTLVEEKMHENARLRKELRRPDKDARALKARLEMEIENWYAAY